MLRLFPKYVLMVSSRVAIWNWNKVIVAIAAGLWTINTSSLIYGESPPLYPP
jgi:hypothetical protein